MTEIKGGQIWREVDVHSDAFSRHVRVITISGTSWVKIRTVVKVDGEWTAPQKSRGVWTSYAKFNAQRGGYELVEDSQ